MKTKRITKLFLLSGLLMATLSFSNSASAQVRDRLEDVRDRREDVRDHRENIRDRREDRRDRREDVRDRREDIRDARHNGGVLDRLEFTFQRIMELSG